MSVFRIASMAALLAVLLLAPGSLWAWESADDVGSINRGGGETAVDTNLRGRGLEVKAGDAFSMRMSTRVQFRFTHQQEVANGSDGTNGRNFNNFRVRRAKTQFTGNIFEKEFEYELLLSWVSGANIVEVARFRWAAMKELNLNAGQYKLAWSWEEITSSGSLQFVDRSYANSVFTQAWAKGVWIDGNIENNMLRYNAGVYNGVLRSNSDFRNNDQAMRGDSFDDGFVDTDMMLNLRLETHPLGRVDYTMNDMRGEDTYADPLFALGLGVNYFWSGFNNPNIRPDTAAGTPASGRSRTSQDTLAITLDGHFRMYGFSVDAALFWRHTEFHNRGSNRYRPTTPARNGISNLSDVGATVEAAYFIIPKEFNVGVRWSYLDSDEVWVNGGSRRHALRPDVNEIGVSANYYLHGNALKLTADVLYVNQQLALPINANGGAGQALAGVYNTPGSRSASSIANDSSDNNALWILRVQLQWIF
jgi:hypothetical protein